MPISILCPRYVYKVGDNICGVLYFKWVKSKGGDSTEPLMSSVRTCLFATSCFNKAC
jgi:hypothetical protein